MLLQKLKEYADRRMSLPPTLYSESPVRYIVELDEGGRLLNPKPTDTSDPASPRTKRGERRPVPQVQRASGIKALLLADNGEYTLGRAREKSDPERVAQCHEAYVTLVKRCADRTREPAVAAVREFLRGDAVGQLSLPADFDAGANITFRVNGVFPIDLPAVQEFWAEVNDPSQDADKPQVMQCLICGQERPALDRLQGKIKGVPGGQTSGTAIISANAKAFESYGLSASLIAPTCGVCGERFTKAANHLLSDRASHILIGNAAFIFWTREEVPFSFVNYFDNPNATDVRALVESARTGRVVAEVDATEFYATVLSGSGGRAVVRDWIDTTVGEMKENLTMWFARQRIVDAWGKEGRPLGLYALAAATVRDPQKELAPPTPRALLRAALTGSPLPYGLLYQAVRRNRAEQNIDYGRATLIKLVLQSQRSTTKEEMDRMIQLDPDNVNPAYHCGRLLAVLADAQYLAVNNTAVVDRFFGTASSAPASVFGRLMRGAQPHLSKLQRDKPGSYAGLQRRLEEIMAGIDGFPRTLALEEQAIFALGFYHQRAYDRAERQKAAERRKTAASGASDEGDDYEESAEEDLTQMKNEEDQND